MRDLPGVLWTREKGRARKLGYFVLTETECRINYEPDAIDLSPASVLLPVPEFTGRPFRHAVNEILPFPAFLWSKIPPAAGPGMPQNIQRRIYLRVLLAANPDRTFSPGAETEYELLMLAGKDGIGHVDVFRSDDEAQRFYAGRRAGLRTARTTSGRGALWSAVRDLVVDAVSDDTVLDVVTSSVGPTPSVPGMIPKLALSIPDLPVWDGSVAAPGVTRQADQSFIDAIVKIQPDHYPGLTELESIAFDFHRRLGFQTPRTWRYTTDDGLELLAVERFDRVDGIPLPMESMFSLLSLGSAGQVITPTEGSYERVAKVLLLRAPSVSGNPAEDAVEFIRRLAMSLLTGNGDMHLENIAILTRGGVSRLSPIFDPAPMRAYPQHSQITAVRFFPNDPGIRGGIPADLADRLIRLAGAYGVTPKRVRILMNEMLEGTSTFLDEVAEATSVPATIKGNLRNAIEPVRYRLEREFGIQATHPAGPRL